MRTIGRRRFMMLAGATTIVLPACGGDDDGGGEAVGPGDPSVAARERGRAGSRARVRRAALTAGPIQLDLAGRVVETWGYSGDALRVTAGEILEVALRNELPEDTTIHWHGLALRNDMDGVHDLTQQPVGRGTTFRYRFAVPDPGTYFFHPHVGLQLDRALHAPLVVDDPDEPGGYDVEHVLVFDDWLDGTPEAAFEALREGGAMGDGEGMDHGNMDMGEGSGSMDTGGTSAMPMAESDLLGGHAGDVAYAMHMVNGRPPEDRPTFEAAAGSRARLRLVNAGSDTAYRVAIGGHRMTVTHADGFPVEPVTVDAILLGMGERYDVLVDVQGGAFPIVAGAEGKGQRATAVLRGGLGQAPPTDATPRELEGRVLRYGDLAPTGTVRLDRRDADVDVSLELTGDEMDYRWSIDGQPFGDHDPVEVEEGQRVRLVLRNRSTMWHPMHLHGHTFALERGGARKDTVNVLPDRDVALVFDADNPGQWMLHCHNTYHQEAGMATVVSYVR